MGKLVKRKETVNTDTGEVGVEYSVFDTRKYVQDNYYSVFYDKLEEFIYKLKPRASVVMVMFLMKKADTDNKVFIYGETRKEALKYCDCSNPQMSKIIANLVSSNIIYRVSRAVYLINPLILYKGGSGKRIKAIEEYNKLKYSKEDGRT